MPWKESGSEGSSHPIQKQLVFLLSSLFQTRPGSKSQARPPPPCQPKSNQIRQEPNWHICPACPFSSFEISISYFRAPFLKKFGNYSGPPRLGIGIGIGIAIATVIGLAKQLAPNLVIHIVGADGEIDADTDAETDTETD